jgi:hypothetical protein
VGGTRILHAPAFRQNVSSWWTVSASPPAGARRYGTIRYLDQNNMHGTFHKSRCDAMNGTLPYTVVAAIPGTNHPSTTYECMHTYCCTHTCSSNVSLDTVLYCLDHQQHRQYSITSNRRTVLFLFLFCSVWTGLRP